jgi:hypothetical protein
MGALMAKKKAAKGGAKKKKVDARAARIRDLGVRKGDVMGGGFGGGQIGLGSIKKTV